MEESRSKPEQDEHMPETAENAGTGAAEPAGETSPAGAAGDRAAGAAEDRAAGAAEGGPAGAAAPSEAAGTRETGGAPGSAAPADPPEEAIEGRVARRLVRELDALRDKHPDAAIDDDVMRYFSQGVPLEAAWKAARFDAGQRREAVERANDGSRRAAQTTSLGAGLRAGERFTPERVAAMPQEELKRRLPEVLRSLRAQRG